VLFFNTSAYAAEIFYGALRAVPSKDIEAADSFGFNGAKKFRRIIWPTMLRLAWPSYTNEAIFLFHATTLVFFTGFPAWQQRVMPSIMQVILQTKLSILLCLIQL
jgi:polar amino acid transport system permease protein